MKIGIVGARQVGATAAYSMMMRRVGSEIMLVDRNTDLAVAQARDILDATPFADPVRVRTGESADLDGARLIVLAAGTPEAGGEPAEPAVTQCRNLCRDRAGSIGGRAGSDLSGGDQSGWRDDPNCRCARRPGWGCVRTGDRVRTILDSARFRTQFAVHLWISPTYIDARVLGENGDSEVLHWSGALICRWRKSPARWAASDRRRSQPH
jgi:L-lactate dehydrogenase